MCWCYAYLGKSIVMFFPRRCEFFGLSWFSWGDFDVVAIIVICYKNILIYMDIFRWGRKMPYVSELLYVIRVFLYLVYQEVEMNREQ